MGIKIITKNKRASYDYTLLQQFEAGLSLVGTEVKSLRQGHCKLAEAYCTIDQKDEAWIYNMSISPYDFGNINNHQETRKRKLLLHKEEILKIEKELALKGATLIPTKIYFKGSKVKIEIAIGKGKKLFDKRESQKEKDVQKKLRQANYE